MLHEFFNGYFLDNESEKVALSKRQIVNLTMAIADDKSLSYLALSFGRIGAAILADVLDPTWNQWRNGEKTDKIRPHWLVRGEQELVDAQSIMVDKWGRRIREGKLSKRVLPKKFDESLSQVFSEFADLLRTADTKDEKYWHVAYALKTGLLTVDDFIFRQFMTGHGLEDYAKIRFFASNMRGSHGLRSVSKVAELWATHVAETEGQQAKDADFDKGKSAKKVAKKQQPVIDMPVALNGK